MPKSQKGLLPQPSRLALNLGILSGFVVGFFLSRHQAFSIAFLITMVCCLIGAAIFAYADVFLHRR